MAGPPTRPALRERYDRKQRQVVIDAAKVFADRGYDQTSVPDLAEALGVSTGSLYHYFGGKEQLLVAICDQLTDGLNEEAKQALAQAATPEAGLRAIVRLWVARVTDYRDHMLVFQQERHTMDGPAWRGVLDSRKRFERLVADTLERVDGIAGDRRLALSALLGMVNHTPQWFRPRGRLAAKDIADGYVDLLLGRSGPPSS
jgi:AcrR family transcriptional regulator